jgi:tight adherence protein B
MAPMATRHYRIARRAGRSASIVAQSFIVLGIVATAAGAQDAKRSDSQIARVDLRADPAVAVVRAAGQPAEVSVSVRGKTAKVTGIAPAQQTNVPTATVLLLDDSTASEPNLAMFKSAAEAYIRGMKPGEELLVMGIGGSPVATTGFSTNPDELVASLAAMAPGGGTAIWSGINAASQVLQQQRPNSIANVVLLVGSRDTVSTTKPSQAQTALANANAVLHLVLYAGNDYPEQVVNQLAIVAKGSGGIAQRQSDPAKVTTAMTAASNAARGLYAVTFTSDRLKVAGNITFVVAGQTIVAGYLPSSLNAGSALSAFPATSGGVGFLRGTNGLLIGLGLGAAAVALGAYAIASLVVKENSGLDSVLQPYSGELTISEDAHGGFQKSALFQRAVEVTSGIADRRGVLTTAEQMLEQANMPLRAGEALTVYAGIVAGALVFGFVLTRSLFMALFLTVIAALLPPAIVNFKAKRRRKKFLAVLPDMLTLLAGTLKAGYSFMQGIEAVSHEVVEPAGAELRRVVTEAQLGRPVDEALEASATRMRSDDFAWAVMAVRIQREVGGNLAELLLTVADTMTQRERLRGEVKALTAEGRISAIVLGALPVLLGIAMSVINPEYSQVLFEDSLGQIMLGAGGFAALIGFWWMKKIIDIKI